ncbi:DUF5710 domain-containing protein [Streptomyces lydicus]|uniref:DUF5710 domain-containing protein n=1 Tax=Streptomyces lydicus TaxID=47763 RepID=UPI0019D6F5FA|nr:DUF5710 domain-containing protein [Streptomyces lydicus]MCZ1012273.1 DUF5710 domain-containing protein [Streptomyces lydicus]
MSNFGRSHGPTRHWLDVPFSQRDAARDQGARWDAGARRWYAPEPDLPELQQWAALPDLPSLLPGEELGSGSGLAVDSVPETCWFTSVRECLGELDYERVRRMVTTRAGRRCEACNRPAQPSSKRWLEVHERWQFDSDSGMQILRRLICLCTPCHNATHFERVRKYGGNRKEHTARAHLAMVSGMTDEAVDQHIRSASLLRVQRSRQNWTLDLSILTNAGLDPQPPPPSGKPSRAPQQERHTGSPGPRKIRIPQPGGSVRRRGRRRR